ncbi:hypothetical protein [Paenibacillus sp. NRS-1760]|uniref:hypothetical protein n=1 Tax=Paenibacillus sp. NRS-1760 TaxID=3233902 RepID=UPI003D2BE132
MQSIANAVLWLLVIMLAVSVLRLRNKVYMPFKLKELLYSDFGAPLGEKFPVTHFQTITGGQAAVHNDSGKKKIILVTSPTCGTCTTLYPLINPFMQNKNDQYEFISMMYGDLQEVKAIGHNYSLMVPIVQLENEESLKAIKTDRFPFGYLLSPDGKVTSKGLITNEEQFDLLLTWAPKQSKKSRLAFYRQRSNAEQQV